MLGTKITGRHLPGGIWGQNLFSIGKILPGGDRLSGLATSPQPGGAGASRQGLRALFGEAASKGKRNPARSKRSSCEPGKPHGLQPCFSLWGQRERFVVENNPQVLPAKLCFPRGKPLPEGDFSRAPCAAAGKTQPLAGHDSRHPGTRAVAWTCPFPCEKAAGRRCAPWRWPPGWLPAPCAPLGDAGELSLLPALIPPRGAESCLAPRASHAAPARRHAHAAPISARELPRPGFSGASWPQPRFLSCSASGAAHLPPCTSSPRCAAATMRPDTMRGHHNAPAARCTPTTSHA